MTYNGSDNIVCEAASKATIRNMFYLMRSRIDVTSSTGTKLSTQRGYWIINPDYSQTNPPCLVAERHGYTITAKYSNLNTAKTQRWLILDESQAREMENSGMIAARDAFDKLYTQASTAVEVPHATISGDADATFNASLIEIKSQYDVAKTANEVTEQTTELNNAFIAFINNTYVKDINNPYDLTKFMNNPDFATSTTGWSVGAGGAYDYSEIEFYVDKAKTATLAQLLKNMPAGSYCLKAQGFQRPGSNDQVYSDYSKGTHNVKVTLDMTMNQRSFATGKVKNIMEERQNTQVHSEDKKLSDGTYVPNTMASTRAHFDKGYYENSIKGYTADKGDLRIYFKGDNNASSSWAICDNFRLYYYGGLTLEEIEERIAAAITVVDTDSAPKSSKIYNLQGQQVSKNTKGIVIINGKKYLK